MVEALRARPRLTVTVAILAICAGLVLASAGEALARKQLVTYFFGNNDSIGTSYVDSDRKVPQYEAYVRDRNPDKYKTIGLTSRNIKFTGADYYATIYIHYDYPQMRNFCATAEDFRQIRAHEQAHSRGWLHGKGRPAVNAAYNAGIGPLGPGGQGCGPGPG